MKPHYYKIILTADDISAIEFAGHAYEWSKVMLGYTVGLNNLREHQAWEIIDAIITDTDDWRTDIPILDDQSNLYKEFMRLYDEVV